jgi:hypothetical protein
MTSVYTWLKRRIDPVSYKRAEEKRIIDSARMYDALLPDMRDMLKQCKCDTAARKSHDETYQAFLTIVLYGLAKNDKEAFDWIEMYTVVFSFFTMCNAHSLSFSFADFLIRGKYLGKGELRTLVKKYPFYFHSVTLSFM